MAHDNENNGKKKRSLAVRIAKAVMWTIVGLIAALLIMVTSAVWFLAPERLTPMAEKLASRQLDADVSIGKAELTFWRSFPNLKVEISDLEVVSRSLDALSPQLRASLPADADSVISVGYFSGSLNVLKIAGGTISVNDVVIDRPRVSLLQVTDTVSNFNIFKAANEPEDTVTDRGPLPAIELNSFVITNSRGITYRSLPDSMDVMIDLRTIELTDKGMPLYGVTVETNVRTPWLHQLAYEQTRFNLGGSIGWSSLVPYQLDLHDIRVKLEDIDLTLDSSLDFTDNLRVESFDASINRLDVASVCSHLPGGLRGMMLPLETNMTVTVTAKLNEPFILGDTLSYPSLDVSAVIPDCYLRFEEINFRNVNAVLTGKVDGKDLNKSVITAERLIIDGKALDIDFKGSVTNLMRDPRIKGHLKGDVELGKLPPTVRNLFDGTVYGRVSADTDFNLRTSYICANRFHRIYLDGEVSLRNFRMESADSVLGAYVRNSRLEFGSNKKIKTATAMVDSMLIVKLTADTVSFHADGVTADVSNLRGGFGSANNHQTADTTVITPFGGALSIGRLTYRSLLDSVGMRLTDARCMASLRRFEGDKRRPLLGLKMSVGRIGVAEPKFFAGLRQTDIDITANLRARRRPQSSDDSVAAADRRRSRRNGERPLTAAQLDSIGVDLLDFNLDNSLRNLMRRWNLHGALSSEKGMVRMTGIPLRSSFSDLDINFTTDSIAINNIDYRLGRSDFRLTGVISDMQRFLSARRPQPLKIDFNLVSDTININELAHAFSRPSLIETETDIDDWADNELEAIEVPEAIPDSVLAPVLVPVNIDAGFTIKADNVIYSDLLLKGFSGELLIYQGVANLHNLSASSEVGDISVNGLYSAPTVRDMSFGMGMNLKDFRIDRIQRVIPAVDSLLPMMNTFSGVVNASVAVTSDLTPDMYFDMSSLKAAMKFEGDSLVVFDNKTFKKLSRWLIFKNKDKNMIDSLDVELTVDSGVMSIYPFIVNIDRYKLGVMGTGDIDGELNYHVAVLKSPIPFRFGINIKGTTDDMKIRFGGPKFKENMVAERDSIANTTRVNLMREMNETFRRGLKAARLGPLDIKGRADTTFMSAPEDVISHEDSVMMIREGFIEPPDTTAVTVPLPIADNKKE